MPFRPLSLRACSGRYCTAAFRVEQGHAVSVVNPAQISAFGSAALSRTKTDRKDARLIARFCAERVHYLRPA